MPGDPFQVFADAPSYKRDSLMISWNELAEALDNSVPKRPGGCALHADGRYRPAVGRITLNGTPACAPCVKTRSKRPGGYPIDRINPKEWRE